MTTIAIGGIMHESNTFSETPTDFAAFSQTFARNLVNLWGKSHHEIGGFIQGATEYNYTAYPTLMASATPAGRVTDDAFDRFTEMLIQHLKAAPKHEGLLLALHGAMVVESYPDGDGEVLRRLRDAFGRDFPIVVTLDQHANVSEQMVAESTTLVIYKTTPHIDQRQRGLQAAELMMRILRDEVTPTQALAKPPMLLNILYHNTNVPPMEPILTAAKQLETRPDVLVASVAAGYPYADVYEAGPSFVVVTDDNPQLAQTEADRLSDMLWNVHEQLTLDLPDAAQAVAQAIPSEQHPVILVEMGDNIGGGSPGDSTFVFAELQRQGASGFVVVLYDPEGVQSCIQAGVGADVALNVGGKADNLHGDPVAIHGKVRLIHDGQFIETQPRHGGQRYHNQGLTTVVAVGDSLVVLTSRRQTPFSLQQLLSLGINPTEMRMIVVKAAVAYRAAYEPIAGQIIEVDTPGLTAVNPLHFEYHNVRRPLFPLD
ncbi:M81 family metallopeptidase [Candidatus Poribacteria bacterium]|nr:M81 family metallopeptidase [Candidatus Poribacteria bacterium]MYG08301.1 M81 family metallopeptidase [Candidatus Poribacteria bacterium]